MDTIKKIFNSFISIILPKDKETIYLESLTPTELLEKIAPARIMEKDGFIAMFDYKDPLCRKAIWQVKYKANEKISSNFASLFYDLILEEISDESTFLNFKNIFIIPIPCSKKRLREKGFNQTEILVKEILRLDKEKIFKFDNNILVKTKETEHQVNVKNREKRLKNLEGSFSVLQPEKIKNSCIVVLDDVITTGATMSEAKKVLKKSGTKKIICMAVAH